jgi:hypothetical protein
MAAKRKGVNYPIFSGKETGSRSREETGNLSDFKQLVTGSRDDFLHKQGMTK